MRACAALSRAIGIMNGEHDTYVMPTLWQNSTDEGSPPCSPQMPILRSGRVRRPRGRGVLGGGEGAGGVDVSVPVADGDVYRAGAGGRVGVRAQSGGERGLGWKWQQRRRMRAGR